MKLAIASSEDEYACPGEGKNDGTALDGPDTNGVVALEEQALWLSGLV